MRIAGEGRTLLASRLARDCVKGESLTDLPSTPLGGYPSIFTGRQTGPWPIHHAMSTIEKRGSDLAFVE
jgi:hypothetical protein